MTKRRSSENIAYMQRQIAIVVGILAVVFIIAQFIVLDLAGIYGPEITDLRAEQKEMKVQNELKRARINELTKSTDIQDYATNNLGMVTTSIETIQLEETQVTAFGN